MAIARRCQRQLFGISSPCVPRLVAVLSLLAHWRGYLDPERIQQIIPMVAIRVGAPLQDPKHHSGPLFLPFQTPRTYPDMFPRVLLPPPTSSAYLDRQESHLRLRPHVLCLGDS